VYRIIVPSMLALLMTAVACSSSSNRGFGPPDAIDASSVDPTQTTDATLTCDWLASSDNCWLAALDDLHACLADGSASGVMKSDGSACSYSDGTVVTFKPSFPAPAPQGEAPAWSFSIAKKGIACAHFESEAHPLGNDTHSRLSTQSGTVDLQYVDGAATFTCPDGSTYVHPHFHDLLSCGGDSGVSTLPGQASGESNSLDYFWLFYGVGSPTPNDHVVLWNCKTAT
jgi:hypothetical protein